MTALHPEKTVAEVRENTGWDIKVADPLGATAPPTDEELHILREELDPDRIYLKGSE